MESVQTKQVMPSAPVLNTDGVLQRKCDCGQHTVAGGSCSGCANKKLLQRKASAAEPVNTAPPVVNEVLRSAGRPLDPETRAFFEPRFNHDFSRVRVHTDSQSAESAREINAMAYTVGNNLVFDSGRYSPETSTGRSLLAHELTHVVQQRATSAQTSAELEIGPNDSAEREADSVESSMAAGVSTPTPVETSSGSFSPRLQRRVNPENVSCRRTGLTNPNLTGDEVVTALQQADAEAITLARRAELLLDFHLLFTRAGTAVDPAFDTILQEELGLTLTNPAQFRLIEQQRDRFRRVRETLESGFLRYLCRGGTVSLVGCTPLACGQNFAFACPGNRLVALCQRFWDTPAEQAATLLHEPFHILFHMARHAPNAIRRADSSCFESFALRVAGQAATASCVGHTAG